MYLFGALRTGEEQQGRWERIGPGVRGTGKLGRSGHTAPRLSLKVPGDLEDFTWGNVTATLALAKPFLSRPCPV